MVKVTLRTYREEIEDLVDQGAFDAAISHCQHILKVYPKYLPAYSLLAKTALEKGDLDAAADLFRRLLSMDPEDFVARVGLSIASDKEGSLDQAVWHMERAFELVPENQAIVAELRRLYGRRDGLEPEKAQLTPGALARLHARGALYTQAINELRELLEAEPDRVDLHVALAETLWRADRRIEAAETSLAILEKLPYCLKANLILGEIWSSSGREREGAAHLERAQMIDPENEFAQALFGKRSPLRRVEVQIGRMEYLAPPAPAEQEPDWLETLIQEGTSPAVSEEAIPDWLQAVAASAELEAASLPDTADVESAALPEWLEDVAATADREIEELAAVQETEAEEPSESEMPDWLAELTAEPEFTGAEPQVSEEIPVWQEEAVPPGAEEPEAAAAELPDWLTEMAPAEAEPVGAEIPAYEEPEIAATELPDWLSEMAPADVEPLAAEVPTAEEPEAGPVDFPDWLSEMAPADVEPPAAEAPTAEELELAAGEIPDWLKEMAPTREPSADIEDLGLAPADIPDWLAEMAPPGAIPSEVPDLDLAPADVPDWLADARLSEAEALDEEQFEEEAETAPPALVAAETPDWLSELVTAAGVSMEEAEAPSEHIDEPEEEEMPEWLAELGQKPEAEVEAPLAAAEFEEPELAYPEEPVAEVTETEADLLARLDEMSPEEAFAAWEAMLAESEEVAPEPEAAMPEALELAGPIVIEEPEKELLVYPEGAGGEVTEAEAELLARMDEMSPEEAFAAWEAMLAESEAAPEPTGAAEEPELEELAYPEEPVAEVTETEADLLARLEEMSPEEAFAAWEAMLAESEAAPEPTVAAEEPELEELAYPEEPVAEVTETEADLLARLDEMSPEEAFAAWEAMLAESEEVAPEPEAAMPEALEPAGPIVIEEPEKELLVYPEGAGGEVTEAEAELLARMDEMSPEEAFAAWEAMLAESEGRVAEEDQAWMSLTEDEEAEAPEMPALVEEALPTEPETEPEQPPPWMEEEVQAAEPTADLDQAWMPLVEDEGLMEAIAPYIPAEEPVAEPSAELEMAEIGVAEEAVAPARLEEKLDAELLAALDFTEGLEEVPTRAEAEAGVAAELGAKAFEPPAWAVAEAAEIALETQASEEDKITLGPDWVLLTEEEETEIRIAESHADAVAFGLEEPSPIAEEPVEEEQVLIPEALYEEPETPVRPTWVALEEEPEVEEVVAKAPVVEKEAIEAEDDQTSLELARDLWASGQKEEASTTYEKLLKTSLRDEIVADLEKITAEEPEDEPALRLLGDAYMRENRLQEALHAYRRALASL